MMNRNFSFLSRETIPGFAHALVLILLSGLLSLLVSFIIAPLSNVWPAIYSWQLPISYILTFGVLLIIAQKWWQVPKFATGKVNLMVLVLVVPLVIALSVVLEALVSRIPMPEKFKLMFEQMIQLDIRGYIMLGIAAPLLEELIFRGVVLKRFLERYPVNKAIVLSSVVFGLAHGNPWQFIPAFVIGLVMGWLYWKCQSVWPGIFMHFINNSLGFVLALYIGNVNTTLDQVLGLKTYVVLLVISIIVIYFALTGLKHILINKPA